MHTVHLNIGSNSGDRLAIIARAVASLSEHFDITGISYPLETPPAGFESQNRFVNVGVSVITDLTPFELLSVTQSIEKTLGNLPHRNPDGTYRDRDLDIDIICYDTLQISTPDLTLPHPRMWERPFVTVPLRQLNPQLACHLYDKRMESTQK